MRAHHLGKMITYFGSSETAKGLFDASDDEDKESSGAFAAVISGKKGNEDTSEGADKESLHSSSKGILYRTNVVCACSVFACLCVYVHVYTVAMCGCIAKISKIVPFYV